MAALTKRWGLVALHAVSEKPMGHHARLQLSDFHTLSVARVASRIGRILDGMRNDRRRPVESAA